MEAQGTASTNTSVLQTSPSLPPATGKLNSHDANYNDSNNRLKRQSTVIPPSRRTTMVYQRTVDHSEPPVENPNNTADVNRQLRQEYERVQQLNHMMEATIQGFELTADNIKKFEDSLEETDQLLDLWTQILSQTQHTKQYLTKVDL